MRASDLADIDSICILGFGREGRATLKVLEKYAPKSSIAIADANAGALKSLQATHATDATHSPQAGWRAGQGSHKLQAGSDYLEQIDRSNLSLIIKSPGIPPHSLIEKWRKEGKLTSATQIFLDTMKEIGSTVIGVTGSKGKSTTSTLIYDILKAAGKDTHLVGNIGKPALAFLDSAKPDTILVMEMSSYQLMDLTTSPRIAVVTSFFPEHLDYHGIVENYLEAKTHITRFQGKDGIVFYSAIHPEAKRLAERSPGKHVPFSMTDSPVKIEETHLLGDHNLSNIAAAFSVARYLGFPDNVSIGAIKNFHALPHRLQSLGMHHGIEWVDDAISTTPESAIAALNALGNRVMTLILGGQDRGNDFGELGKKIAPSSIAHVILFPGSGPRIRSAIEKAGAKVSFHEADSMSDAVAHAKKVTAKSKICLLSTASPSYGMFKNFEEKGDEFKRCIAQLPD